MAFSKKNSSGKSLGLYANDPGSSDPQHSAGVSPVNSQGQVTDKTGKVMDWPFNPGATANATNPLKNVARPTPLGKERT